MSRLIDTNLISLCHKKNLPAQFAAWLGENAADCFLGTATIAEMRFGVELATNNARHFELLKPLGLQVENPLA